VVVQAGNLCKISISESRVKRSSLGPPGINSCNGRVIKEVIRLHQGAYKEKRVQE
jgi:hypothetical protein